MTQDQFNAYFILSLIALCVVWSAVKFGLWCKAIYLLIIA